jgi:thiazole synthase ThiGH ThiG subunit
MATLQIPPTPNAAELKAGNEVDDLLTIGGKTFKSRLMLGTGKYRNAEEMNAALEASGCEIVTVALRRIDLDQPKRTILDEIDWQKYHILPNTQSERRGSPGQWASATGSKSK